MLIYIYVTMDYIVYTTHTRIDNLNITLERIVYVS